MLEISGETTNIKPGSPQTLTSQLKLVKTIAGYESENVNSIV